MSTWLYMRCLDHDPIIKADSESGQHLTDLPMIRRMIANRVEEVKLYNSQMLPSYDSPFELSTAYFLAKHPHCKLGIIDEYGRTYPRVAPEGETC